MAVQMTKSQLIEKISCRERTSKEGREGRAGDAGDHRL
jgi:hypothetical protein